MNLETIGLSGQRASEFFTDHLHHDSRQWFRSYDQPGCQEFTITSGGDDVIHVVRVYPDNRIEVTKEMQLNLEDGPSRYFASLLHHEHGTPESVSYQTTYRILFTQKPPYIDELTLYKKIQTYPTHQDFMDSRSYWIGVCAILPKRSYMRIPDFQTPWKVTYDLLANAILLEDHTVGLHVNVGKFGELHAQETRITTDPNGNISVTPSRHKIPVDNRFLRDYFEQMYFVFEKESDLMYPQAGTKNIGMQLVQNALTSIGISRTHIHDYIESVSNL